MSWFCTSAFHFELPGEEWEERTLNLYRPGKDPNTVFMVGRAKIPEGGIPPADEVLASLPMGPYDDREIVKQEIRRVGPLDAEDMTVTARAGTSSFYYRFVSVPYYDLEVTFQFAGPITDRAQIDARAEEALQSVRFRKR